MVDRAIGDEQGVLGRKLGLGRSYEASPLCLSERAIVLQDYGVRGFSRRKCRYLIFPKSRDFLLDMTKHRLCSRRRFRCHGHRERSEERRVGKECRN